MSGQQTGGAAGQTPQPPAAPSTALPEALAFGFLGSYQLLQPIGAGGVARVFRARHAHPQYAERPCAVKIMHEEIAKSPSLLQLFRDECYVLAMLAHPNVVRTFEAGVESGWPYIAMEYVDGRDLGQVLERLAANGRSLPVPLALFIITRLLRALAYAHDAVDGEGETLGFVHRDVNPHNLFIAFDGRVKLGDFGAALLGDRAQDLETICGKIGYFAPEQLDGKPTDRRADIFAAGVVMYELLCGQMPFGDPAAPDALAVNRKAKYVKPRKLQPGMSPELEKVIRRALERKPKNRFQTAGEMLDALWPLLPSFTGMKLALAAMMRNLFVNEYGHELKLRVGLTGENPLSGRQPLIGLCGLRPERRAQLRQIAEQVGFAVEEGDNLRQLATKASSLTAALVLLSPDSAYTANLIAACERFDLRLPLVAVADRLDGDELRVAHALHVVDLLYGTIVGPRLLTALLGSIANRGAPAVEDEDEEEKAEPLPVLMVTRDVEVSMAFETHLPRGGYRIVAVDGAATAVDSLNHATFHALILDVDPDGRSPGLELVDAIRHAPGIGLLPVIFLAAADRHEDLGGVTRSTALERQAPVSSVARALDNLRTGVQQSRTFVRYATQLPAELLFGGAHHQGQISDVSRGGIALDCPAIPHVGTRIQLVLRLPDRSIRVGGRVARVGRPNERGGAVIGVELGGMSRADEAAFVGLIADLARQTG